MNTSDLAMIVDAVRSGGWMLPVFATLRWGPSWIGAWARVPEHLLTFVIGYRELQAVIRRHPAPVPKVETDSVLPREGKVDRGVSRETDGAAASF
jgi:hypothetical protein